MVLSKTWWAMTVKAPLSSPVIAPIRTLARMIW